MGTLFSEGEWSRYMYAYVLQRFLAVGQGLRESPALAEPWLGGGNIDVNDEIVDGNAVVDGTKLRFIYIEHHVFPSPFHSSLQIAL